MSDPLAVTSSSTALFLVACLCAEWCSSCREYRETFRQAQQQYLDTRFVWVDIEDQPDLVGDISVEDFPTLMIAAGDGSDAHPAIDGSTQAYVWRAPRWSPDARFVTATTGSPEADFQNEVWIIDVASRTVRAKLAIPALAAAVEGEPGGSDVVGFQRVAP